MRRVFMAAMAAVLVTGAATAASAGTFMPAPNGRQMFDLDTAAGAYSLWQKDDLAGHSAARISFALRQVRPDPGWVANFQFALTQGEDRVTVSGVYVKHQDAFVVALKRMKGLTVLSEQRFETLLKLDEVNSLDLDWDPSGKVTAVLRPGASADAGVGERLEAQLPAAVAGMQVSNSTGELEVTSLAFGVTAP